MFRGDTKNLTFKIKHNGQYVDGSTYSEVEVQFNQQGKYVNLKKLKSKGEVTWDTDHFSCRLSQEETFKFRAGDIEFQVRLFVNGNVNATIINHIQIEDTLSSEVIG